MSRELEEAAGLLRSGKAREARDVLRRALQRRPQDATAMTMLAKAHFDLGEFDQAGYQLERSLTLDPGNTEALGALVRIAASKKDSPGVVLAAERLLERDPKQAWAHELLINAHLFLGDAPAAERAAERVLRVAPDVPESWKVAALYRQMSGDTEAAVALLRAGIERHPRRADLHDYLCFALNYTHEDPSAGGESVESIFGAHAAFGRGIAEAFTEPPPMFPNPRDPERRLRVAYVSPDLRDHSVSFFLEPILACHDRAMFEPRLYHIDKQRDAGTDRLAALAPLEHVGPIESRSLAGKLRQDGTDIVVDLAGHTAGHRLYALAHHPAPVVATYLGYPNTTGLRCVGWRLVDRHTDPPADAGGPGLPADWPGAQAFATERLISLDPCFLCYRPRHAAEIGPGPALRGEPPVFGSFNNLTKLNAPLARLWARAVDPVAGARLLIKGDFRHAARRERVLGWFAAAGLDPARVLLVEPTKTIEDHLGSYRAIDVALDAYPYHGTTTTCEALHMGVPVVTLAGRRHASRVGVSLLNAIGRSEWIASDADDFARIAQGLITDREQLAAERATLRDRLAGSALCDGPGFTRRFEGALRTMWRSWCGA